MDPNLLKGNLDLIVLSVLSEGPMYGLRIIQEMQGRTDGYFDFKEGSLYPALHRLTKAGMLETEYQPSSVGGAPRKFYRLTEEGGHELERKRRAFGEFVGAVQALGNAPKLGGAK